MDVLASIMTFLNWVMFILSEYDYLIFPPLVGLCAYFAKDNRDKLLLCNLAIIYAIDAFVGTKLYSDVSTFYLFNIFVNIAVFGLLVFVRPLWKLILLQLSCVFIIWMNYHEHSSPYQTFMYPYIDSIHSWYLELLILTIMVKFKGR